tara:strand:+ start:2647 stop:2838 length:192 start_codon:yes stop_codon:yes gene_type:complete
MSEYSRINKLKRANKNLHMAKDKEDYADLLRELGMGSSKEEKRLRRGASIHRDRAAVLHMQAK